MVHGRKDAWLWVLALPLAACGPAVSDADVPQSESSTTQSTPPSPPVSDTTGVTTSPGTGESTAVGDASSAGASTGFLYPDWGLSGPCSTYQQDCPRGEKCTAYSPDGVPGWSSAGCFPVVPDPDATGEPCMTLAGAYNGPDTCARGDMCWDVEPSTQEGICVRQCTGSEQEPICPAGSTCTINADGFLAVCLPLCDPLNSAETCGEAEGCYPIDGGFICAPDASGREGAPGEACEFPNGCDPGTVCTTPVPDLCPSEGSGCCVPVCDLDAPDCPGALACIPWFEPGVAPPEVEHVGLCSMP